MLVQVINAVNARNSQLADDLNIETIYHTIGNQKDPAIIGSFLSRIVDYEFTTNDLITKLYKDIEKDKLLVDVGEVWNNFILCKFFSNLGYNNNTSTSIIKEVFKKYFTYEFFIGVYWMILNLDWSFINHIPNVQIHILSHNGKYLGHLYSWNDTEKRYHTLNEQPMLSTEAIRTSIENYLFKLINAGHGNVGLTLVDSTVIIAKESKFELIRVIHPLPIMRRILEKYGFRNFEIHNYIFDLQSDISTNTPKYNIEIYK